MSERASESRGRRVSWSGDNWGRGFLSQVLFVKMQHPLRARSVDDGQFGLGAVEAAVFVLGVPDQEPPQLAVGALTLDRLDGLDERVPRAVLGRRRLPLVVAFVRPAAGGDGGAVLFKVGGRAVALSVFAFAGAACLAHLGSFRGVGFLSGLALAASLLGGLGLICDRLAADTLPVFFQYLLRSPVMDSKKLDSCWVGNLFGLTLGFPRSPKCGLPFSRSPSI